MATLPTLHVERNVSGRQKRYSAHEIDRGLIAIALNNGSVEAASEACGIPKQTLDDWKRFRHAKRYQEIIEKHQKEIDAQMTQTYRETANYAAQAAHLGVQKTIEQLENGTAKDPAAASRNMATVAGILTDKYLIVSGRPNHVTEHRTGDEAINSLKSTAPWLFAKPIEGTAEEIKDTTTS